ncbi:MAG: PilZ domain-containing protein [Thiomicrorhabdus chilensis]|uniref:PilZ domain-containing protein n=1 Tax=Thiomicrorhabdus chilensis TaxID=63656 RepID=UPI00299E099D|nr:PilZ domain-containing protein [Thiomicrorhabdus chilensis]MDX1347771.1 PilZ domain-containing protein [Thiomicrorhabdus chilensis]
MNKWFRKGNARRFYRIDMPVRHFIVPSSPIKDREIYATGANYFPASFKSKVEAQKFHALHWANRIQEHSETLLKIFDEIIQFVEFFGECALSISEGQNPRQDPKYWMRVHTHLNGFQNARLMESSSPKTYQYIKMIEEKYMTFLRSMVASIEKSTPTHFSVDDHLPHGFKVDEMISMFESAKFDKIPLVQTLRHVSAYMDSYLEAYRYINEDNYLKQFPSEWKVQMANVSASGLAVHLGKRFEQYSRVDVYLYFPEDEKVLQFDGTVVDTRTDDKTLTERVAINFEFPDGVSQDYLQTQIQKQEVKDCMDIVL